MDPNLATIYLDDVHMIHHRDYYGNVERVCKFSDIVSTVDKLPPFIRQSRTKDSIHFYSAKLQSEISNRLRSKMQI